MLLSWLLRLTELVYSLFGLLITHQLALNIINGLFSCLFILNLVHKLSLKPYFFTIQFKAFHLICIQPQL